MTDNLRDRIAAVLCESFPVSVDTYLGLAVADVLIREIGLMREYGVKEKGEPEPGVLSFDRDEITKYVREGDVMMRRWITDWVESGDSDPQRTETFSVEGNHDH